MILFSILASVLLTVLLTSFFDDRRMGSLGGGAALSLTSVVGGVSRE
jgi:hypothetical protein